MTDRAGLKPIKSLEFGPAPDRKKNFLPTECGLAYNFINRKILILKVSNLIIIYLIDDSQAGYIRSLVLAAKRIGVRVVVFNYRGMGGIKLEVFYSCNPRNVNE